MPHQELWDPTNPQFDRRPSGEFPLARQYMVGEVSAIRKDKKLFRVSVRMFTDDRTGIHKKPLVIKARSSEKVQEALDKVRMVADEEAQAFVFFKRGDSRHGEMHREWAQRARQILVNDYKVHVPVREWDYHKGVGLTFAGGQGKMF